MWFAVRVFTSLQEKAPTSGILLLYLCKLDVGIWQNGWVMGLNGLGQYRLETCWVDPKYYLFNILINRKYKSFKCEAHNYIIPVVANVYFLLPVGPFINIHESN